MDEKNFVDVSSFMLFEATGDSEADSHELNMASGDGNDDDDDAESCINDLLESKPIFELRDPIGPRHHYGDHNDGGDDEKRVIDQDWANDDDDDDGDDDDDDDTGNSHDDQDPLHVDDGDGDDVDDDNDEVVMKSTAKTRQHKKARVCVDSTMGLLNEMEKSRLFWEACLAS